MQKKSPSESNNLKVLLIILAASLILSFLLLRFSFFPLDRGVKVKAGFFCPREESYPNPPELNEAVNLVKDRIGEKLGGEQQARLDRVLGNWFNCLNMEYRDLPEDVEGAFVFDQGSTGENLQIFVDEDYQNYTDLLRALLLSHELRHVLQFLELKAIGKESSCVEKEAEAFRAQFVFISSLHFDEKRSLHEEAIRNLRSDVYAPVIELFLIHKTVQNKCGTFSGACYKTELDKLLTEMIITNPGYQEQCDL